MERAIGTNTCAVLIEPIQGEGGVNVPPDGYLKRICGRSARERNVLFVADEVQTGFGRTGDLFACDYESVRPDILIVGKALGGGYYPVSAALADDELMRLFHPGRPREHVRRKSAGVGRRRGRARRDPLGGSCRPRAPRRRARSSGASRAIGSPLIEEVRGRGLLIGIELTIPAHRLSEALLERGVAAKDTRRDVLRIAPPLVIDDDAVDYLLERFTEAIGAVGRRP